MRKRVVDAILELERVAPVLHQQTTHFLGASDTCIASTRLVLKLMRQLGFRGKAVPVSVCAFNPHVLSFAKSIDVDGLLEAARTHAHDPEGWSIGIDRQSGATGSGWNGHLVALIERQVFVDMTVSQFARPAYQMEPAPYVIGLVPKGWPKNGDACMCVSNGTALVYAPDTLNTTFDTSPDWLESGSRDTIVRATLSAIA